MKKTGIKVWVLTGDKIGTAMNIGLSAGLLDNEMPKYVIRDIEDHEASKLDGILDKTNEDIDKSIKQDPDQK